MSYIGPLSSAPLWKSQASQTGTALAARGVIYTSDYAKHDCKIATGCSVNGTTVTIPGAAMTQAADGNKEIAGSDVLTGGDWKSLGTIVTVNSPTTCTVSIAGDVVTTGTTQIVYGTNDKVALQTAYAAAAGKTLVFNGGLTWLGVFGPGTVYIIQVSDSNKPVEIRGFGCTIVCVSLAAQTTPTVIATAPVLFRLIGPLTDYNISGVKVQDLGADPMASDSNTDADRGIWYHYTDRTAGDLRRLSMVDCHLLGGFAFFSTYNAGAYTIDQIFVDECYMENVYYGCAFDECGDGFVGNYRTKKVRRNYFAHGVKGHRVNCRAEDNLPASSGCLIKSYNKVTKDIHVDINYFGTRTTLTGLTATSVAFEQQNDDPTTGGLENINVVLDDTDDAGCLVSCVFRAYTTNGTLQTSTSKMMRGIKVSGKHKFPPVISTTFTQSPGPDIELDAAAWRQWLSGFLDTQGLVFTHGLSRYKAKRGAGTNPLQFEFGDLVNGCHPFSLQAYAIADRTSFAGAGATDGFKTFRRKISTLNGTVSLRPEADDTTGGFQTTDPALALTTSGTLLQLAAGGAGYAGGNCFMSAVLTLLAG